MNTSALKLLSLLAFVGCVASAVGVRDVSRLPVLLPEARPVLGWEPDLDTDHLVSSKENAPARHDELLARPIFAPSRRPFVPPPPVVVEPPPQPVAHVPQPPVPEPDVAVMPPPQPLIDPRQFQLKGIMETGKKTSALIATPQTPEGAWQGVLSDVMGWTLVRIGRNSVVLRGDGREFVLEQYGNKSSQNGVDNAGGAPRSETSAVN